MQELLAPETLITRVFATSVGVVGITAVFAFLLIMVLTKQITGLLLRAGPAFVYIIVTAFIVMQYYDVLVQQMIESGLVNIATTDSFLKGEIVFIAFAPMTWDMLLGAYWKEGSLQGRLVLLFLMMFVFGYFCMVWAFRSFGGRNGLIASTVGYPIWGLSFPYYSQWISFGLFGLMSKQIGLLLVSSLILGVAFVLYIFYHPIEETINLICEDCGIDPMPGDVD